MSEKNEVYCYQDGVFSHDHKTMLHFVLQVALHRHMHASSYQRRINPFQCKYSNALKYICLYTPAHLVKPSIFLIVFHKWPWCWPKCNLLISLCVHSKPWLTVLSICVRLWFCDSVLEPFRIACNSWWKKKLLWPIQLEKRKHRSTLPKAEQSNEITYLSPRTRCYLKPYNPHPFLLLR